MKKVMTGLLLSSMGLMLVAPQILAAEKVETDLSTIGDINFVVDDDGETSIVVPNEKDEPPEVLVPDGGKWHEKGALRIEYVPDFHFGRSNNLTVGIDNKNVEAMKYGIKVGGVEPAAKDQVIPPFVQVRDYRGMEDVPEAKWELSAKATPFVVRNNDDTILDELTGAHIKLPGSTLTMDFGTTADSMAEGQDLVNNAIPVSETDSIVVLSTKESKTTSGHKVSNVFQNDYQRNKDYNIEPIDGVVFHKPLGKAPLANRTYTSNITWTLTAGL